MGVKKSDLALQQLEDVIAAAHRTHEDLVKLELALDWLAPRIPALRKLLRDSQRRQLLILDTARAWRQRH